MKRTRTKDHDGPIDQDLSTTVYGPDGLAMMVPLRDGVPDLSSYATCDRCNGRQSVGDAIQGGYVLETKRVSGRDYEYARACPRCVYGAWRRHRRPQLPWASSTWSPGHPPTDRREQVQELRRKCSGPKPNAEALMRARIMFLVEQGRASEIASDTIWRRGRLANCAERIGIVVEPDESDAVEASADVGF